MGVVVQNYCCTIYDTIICSCVCTVRVQVDDVSACLFVCLFLLPWDSWAGEAERLCKCCAHCVITVSQARHAPIDHASYLYTLSM